MAGWHNSRPIRAAPERQSVCAAAAAFDLLQGIVGSVPYASLVFLTLYFQASAAGQAAESTCLTQPFHGQPWPRTSSRVCRC